MVTRLCVFALCRPNWSRTDLFSLSRDISKRVKKFVYRLHVHVLCVARLIFFCYDLGSLTCCYSEKNVEITTCYRYLVRFPIREIDPSKAYTCNWKKRERKMPKYMCDTSEILTLNSFFRGDKDSQRFG